MTQTQAPPVAYDASVEHAHADEPQTIADIDATMAGIREKTFQDSGHARRSVHAKSQGALLARLVVEPNLPDALAQGLFARPGEYDAVMRFSTIPGDILDDKVSVPRGLAVKILGVEGERLAGSEGDSTQNFLFINAPAFNAPSARKFLSSLKLVAATTDKAEGAKRALSSLLQISERVVETFGGKSATLVSLGGHPETHVLGETYYTAAALRHGRYMAKLSITPSSPQLRELTDRKVDLEDRPDGLRDAVIEFMRHNHAEWALQVQLCTDLERMPIEDASVEWPQADSPYVTVARLVAAPQLAWSETIATQIDDRMFFSPWRGLAAHRPLGNVMRARKLAYEHSARFRAARLGSAIEEPSALPDWGIGVGD